MKLRISYLDTEQLEHIEHQWSEVNLRPFQIQYLQRSATERSSTSNP
jgi:hypothetical protein